MKRWDAEYHRELFACIAYVLYCISCFSQRSFHSSDVPSLFGSFSQQKEWSSWQRPRFRYPEMIRIWGDRVIWARLRWWILSKKFTDAWTTEHSRRDRRSTGVREQTYHWCKLAVEDSRAYGRRYPWAWDIHLLIARLHQQHHQSFYKRHFYSRQYVGRRRKE